MGVSIQERRYELFETPDIASSDASDCPDPTPEVDGNMYPPITGGFFSFTPLDPVNRNPMAEPSI